MTGRGAKAAQTAAWLAIGFALGACSVSVPTIGRAGPPPVSDRAAAEAALSDVEPPATGIGAVAAIAVAPNVGAGSLGVAAAVYDQALSTAAARADAAVRGPCAEAQFGALPPERLEPPVKLDGEAGLAFLRERVRVTGCGGARVHALYPRRTDNGEVAFEAGPPGASIAALEVQREVVRQIVSQAVGHLVAEAEGGFARPDDAPGAAPPRGCDPTKGEPWVLDTALIAPLERGRWREAWTIGACDRTVTLDIAFALGPKGAQFRSSIPLAWDEPAADEDASTAS